LIKRWVYGFFFHRSKLHNSINSVKEKTSFEVPRGLRGCRQNRHAPE
jgi:hypothetical protein